ncbi:titin-like [Ylistrum balloti]|uniref:titin-like n=1 Tax=Ylistrum balloti TaxID=509963 RepID=UPI002905D0E4|nr:titin-like [Ylistrum balloti]
MEVDSEGVNEDGGEQAEEEWPTISRFERIYYEILFYSQGPLDGYLLGERARDLFLHSRLPLMTLSRIWNLADVTNDNVLNVDEFVLAMHLTHGILRGRKIPKVLPHNLKPKSSTSVQLPNMSDREKEAYIKVFQSLDTSRKGYFEGTEAREALQSSELSPEQLVDVWDLSDLNKDGCLDTGEWTVACQLVRLHKQGYKLEGSINAFTYLPDRISPNSLQARKQRVNEYDSYKQRLMSIKEKRKAQAVQESRRLTLLKDKISLEKDLVSLYKIKNPVSEDRHSRLTETDTQEIEKLEEIIVRLKKEHEKIRQDTVKVILGEQKLQGENTIIKEETSELNKRLSSLHSKATKDPDPFHQLYEQRREERKKSNLSEGEEPEVHYPFKTSPFDKDAIDRIPVTGASLFLNSHATDNNNKKYSKENEEILTSLHSFGEKFMEMWSSGQSGVSLDRRGSCSVMEEDDDTVFMTIKGDDDDDRVWSSVGWVNEQEVRPEDSELVDLHKKLVDLKEEMKKLNKETGGKLVFRNPSDYLARKKAKEEEELEKAKPKRSKSSVDSDYVVKRRSWIDRRKDNNDAHSQEIRSKRRSLNLDSKADGGLSPRKTAPDRPQRLPVKSDSQIPVADRSHRNLDSSVVSESGESSVPRRSPRRATSPTTSPTRSTKKTRAPPPPVSPPVSPVVTEPVPITSPRKSKQEKVVPKISKEEAKTQEVNLSEKVKQEVSTPTKAAEEVVNVEKETPSRPPRKKRPSSSVSPDRAITVPSVDLSNKTSDKKTEKSEVRFSPEPELIPDAPLVNGEVRFTQISIDPRGDESTETVPVSVNKVVKSPNNQALSEDRNSSSQVTSLSLRSDKSEQKIQVTNQDTSLSNGHLPPTEIVEEQIVQVQKSKSESVPQIKSTIFDDSIVDEEVELTFKKFSQQPPDVVSLAESIQSTHSGTSTESFAPTLPSSPPPLLPLGGIPKKLASAESVEEEVLEVVASPIVEHKPIIEEKILESEPIVEEVIEVTKVSKKETLPEVIEVSKVSEKETLPEVIEVSKVSEKETLPEVIEVTKVSKEESLPEVIEVTKVSEKETLPEVKEEIKDTKKETNLIVRREVTSPVSTVSELRAEFFGIKKKTGPVMSEEIVFEDDLPQTNGHVEHMDVYINDLKNEVSLKEAEDRDEDSDVSDADEEQNSHFKATFIPGDAKTGTLPTDVALDDENDGGIQLISFNTTENSMLQSPGEQSQTDSAFDELMSSTDHDNSNQVSLCNTLEDFQEQEEEVVTESIEIKDFEEYHSPPINETVEVEEVTVVESTPQTSEPELDTELKQPEPEQKPVVIETIEMVKEVKVESAPRSVYSEPETPVVDEFVPNKNTVVSPPETPQNASFNAGLRDTSSIVRKARNFSDIITEPPKFTVKASTKEVSEERLKQMDIERKAILQQSMKSTKSVDISYSDEEEVVVEDNSKPSPSLGVADKPQWNAGSEEDSTTETDYKVALKSSVKWEDVPEKVNLYSANVVDDGKTTEIVDRESIADLGSTRKQWETLFLSSTPSSAPKPTPKKAAVKHWEVKLPYKPVGVVNSAETTAEEPPSERKMEDEYANESAIAREIRLANEREEMLKREQEDRMELLKRQEESKQTKTIATFEAQNNNNNNNELKTMYHEMTEADRGSELQRRETIIKQEIEEQQEREQAVSQNAVSDSEEADSNNDQIDATESVIAREIRLQHEREEEIAKQRQTEVSQPPPVAPTPVLSETKIKPEEAQEVESDPQSEISYEEAIGAYQHVGESLIARELREIREREEELQKMRETLSKPKPVKESPKPVKESPISSSKQSVQKSTPQKSQPTKTNYLSPSVQNKVSSQSTPNKSIHVTMTPPVTPQNQSDAFPTKSETPIEKEIRLARERENELRRQKGLPEIAAPEPTVNVEPSPVSNGTDEDFFTTVSPYRNLRSSEKSAAMRNYGSSRLQRELEKQRIKEMAMKQEGTIKSTSEDHIQTLKYTEEKSDKPVKRNFNIQRRSISNMSNDSEKTPSEHSDTDSLKDLPITPVALPKEEVPNRFKRSISAGSNLFSYKETTQKAESKIEKELREMREREEELRLQREKIAADKKANTPS